MEEHSPSKQLEDLEWLLDLEQRIEETFPWRDFSMKEKSVISWLVAKSVRLKLIEEKLKDRENFYHFLLETSNEHTDFFKAQWEEEKSKWNMKNLILEALKGGN